MSYNQSASASMCEPASTRGAGGREKWVDAARVLAMIMVMQSHVYLHSGCFHAQPYMAGGAVGVFFVLAGYFSRFKSWRSYARRLLALICFYVFWALYAVFVDTHGHIADIASLSVRIWQGDCGAMWFLRYLLIGLILQPVVWRIPVWLRVVAACVLYAWGCWETIHEEYTHVSMNLAIALSLFLTGNCAGRVCLPEVSRHLFLQNVGFPLWCSVVLGSLILLALYMAALLGAAYLPEQVALPVSIWGLLAVARGVGEYLPRLNNVLASGGASVIFAYGFHMPTFRMYTSVWLRISNQFPPPWMDYMAIAMMLVGCGYVYRASIGRNRIVDAIVFGR